MPFVYLGVPLFVRRLKIVHLKFLADCTKDKLSSWMGKHLTMVGRIYLVRSITASMFVHTFMIYMWPGSFLQDVNKAIMHFIWTGSISNHKSVTVFWFIYCSSIKSCGLDIKDLKKF